MALRAKFAGLFPKMPDVDQIRQELEEKFQLIDGHLESIDRNIEAILGELRIQRGAP